jgi:hypothetical protein
MPGWLGSGATGRGSRGAWSVRPRRRAGQVPTGSIARAGRYGQFVFGFVTAETAGWFTSRRAGLRSCCFDCSRFRNADDLKAFGGFVVEPVRGSVVITYRQDGTELSRSVDLV